MFPEGEELALDVVVVDEEAHVGWGSVTHSLEGIDCGTDSSGNLVGAKVEAVVDYDAVVEDEECRGFVDWVGNGVYHDVGGAQCLCRHQYFDHVWLGCAAGGMGVMPGGIGGEVEGRKRGGEEFVEGCRREVLRVVVGSLVGG